MDLARLNPPQREAVLTTEGPVLVLAGAGSGKTRVIANRIGHLLESGVSPRAILALTFTNKAAGEMKERVVLMSGAKGQKVTLTTFHAFGAEILREHISELGWPKKFAIADTGDQLALIRRAMRDRRIDDRAFDPRKVLSLISRAKNSGQALAPPEGLDDDSLVEALYLDGPEPDDDASEGDPEPLAPSDDYSLLASMVFPLYQRALKAQGSVDFDDLLVLPTQLFERFPHLVKHYTDRFRYLMVDEFQDTNVAQLVLLKLLAGKVQNVCAVGDDDQCIYTWRGAEVRNILEYERSFPGAKEIRLEQNYRSTSVILDAANAVIVKSAARRAKRMWSDVAGGPLISVVSAPGEDDEGRFVAHEIAKAVDRGVPADDIAVLYRTNGQARPIEEALREKGIYYEVIGGSEFFDRREVKDVIAYFRVIANPADELSLLRIVNVPARGIGDVTMERMIAAAKARGEHLWDTMKAAARHEALPEPLPKGAAEKVGGFVELVERYRALFDRGNLAEVTRKLLEEIGFREAARSNTPSLAAADRKLKSIDEVLASLDRYEKREGPKASLLTYLNRLALDSRDEEEVPGGGQKVSLMTLHASKGLEFRVVFLIGMEEELLPHKGMQGEPQNLEEERRLCYVGITRAKEKLFLTRATTRVKRGKAVPRTPSRFLEDLPKELCEITDLDAPPAGPPTERERNFFSNLKEKLKQGAANPGLGGASGPGSTRSA